AGEVFDALAELLQVLDVPLRHPPGAVGSVGGAVAEPLDLLLHLEVPGDVGHQVAVLRKRPQRLDDDRLLGRQIAQTGHADQARRSSATSAGKPSRKSSSRPSSRSTASRATASERATRWCRWSAVCQAAL